MTLRFLLLTATLALASTLHAGTGRTLYELDFQAAELDKAPPDLLILDGGFAVKAEGDQKFLELPGDPLETFGLLTLPKDNLKENIAISARMFGTSKGRRAPTFSAGLCGVGGYKLQISPGKKQLELFRSDTLKAAVPYDWKSGTWTQVRLQVRKVGAGNWKIEGKVWAEGQPEPEVWTLTYDETVEPPGGRPGLWGSPFAGTPIRYDDLKITTVD